MKLRSKPAIKRRRKPRTVLSVVKERTRRRAGRRFHPSKAKRKGF